MNKTSGSGPKALRVINIFLFLAAAVGLLATVIWREKVEFLHKAHTTGIETEAAITGAWINYASGTIKNYTVDLSWAGPGRKTYSAKGAVLSLHYGRDFMSAMGVMVKTLPIKYLPEEPGRFILYKDPENDEAAHARILLLSEIAAGIGLLGLPLFIVRRLYERRRRA